jgi:hypothetical protein
MKTDLVLVSINPLNIGSPRRDGITLSGLDSKVFHNP